MYLKILIYLIAYNDDTLPSMDSEQTNYKLIRNIMNTEKQDLKTETLCGKANVTFRASFKGEMEKEHFYKLIMYIDDMKLRGWVFEKHDRKNGKNDTLKIDYVLVKYGR
jgi:hypothetical protein